MLSVVDSRSGDFSSDLFMVCVVDIFFYINNVVSKK